MMNNWEKLCKQIKPIIGPDTSEEVFHAQFAVYLETIFNWDEENIINERPVQMGTTKYSDIVLKGNDFGIVIEMKKPGIELGSKEEGQLFSYMRISRYKYGFLIGKRFMVFYDDDTDDTEQPKKVADFDFNPKNPDGEALGEILDKAVCSGEKLKDYALARIKKFQTEEEIEQLKQELVINNSEKIKKILETGLKSRGYKEEVVSEIIKAIIVNFRKEGPIVGPSVGGKGPKKKKDHTRYRFKDTIYPKRRLVLAVISDYIRNHPGITLEEIKTEFPPELQGSAGVVDLYETAKNNYIDDRYFFDEAITLTNGQKIVVCNQWGPKIVHFIEKAKDIGYTIEALPKYHRQLSQ